MRTRRLLIVGSAIVILASLLVAVALTVRWCGFSAERAHGRIRLGMTLSEVENAVGTPPGYYRSTPLFTTMQPVDVIRVLGLPLETLAETPPPNVERWIWDDYCIWVAFDNDGKAVGCYLLKVTEWPPPSPGLFDRIRNFLGI